MKENTPENNYKDPNDFYNFAEANRYENSSGMKKIQFLLTDISLKLFLEETNNHNKDIDVLDIGAGTGFSLDFLKDKKYNNLVGIEPSREMLKISKNKEHNCYLGNFSNFLKILDGQKFDLIISISALQWILANKQDLEIKNTIKKIGKDLKKILKEEGRIIIQYYPFHKDINEYVVSAFLRAGFRVKEYRYNEGNIKKEKIFLILSLV